MIKRFFVAVVLLILVACRQTGQTPSEFGSSTPAPLSFGSSADDNSGGVVINAKIGAVFVTGSTYGSLDGPNRGGSDGYVRRYSRGGRVVWRRQFGTGQYDYAGGVATDEEANVYVVEGSYRPTSQKAFIRKFNKNGTPIWTRVFSINGRGTYAGIVRKDKNGYVYVAGGISDYSPSSAFPSYLRNYTPSGSVVWTRRQDTGGVSTEATSLGTNIGRATPMSAVGTEMMTTRSQATSSSTPAAAASYGPSTWVRECPSWTSRCVTTDFTSQEM